LKSSFVAKRTDDSGLKLSGEKNSSIAMELEMDVTRARKFFLLHYLPEDSRSSPSPSGGVFMAGRVLEWLSVRSGR
jgi:hypothetical protein